MNPLSALNVPELRRAAIDARDIAIGRAYTRVRRGLTTMAEFEVACNKAGTVHQLRIALLNDFDRMLTELQSEVAR